MVVIVQDAEDADMQEIFTVGSRAFDRNEPFWDATFLEHWTEQGRVAGGKRFLEFKHAAPYAHYIKAVDTETGRIAGFARWLVYKNHVPETPGPDVGQHWPTEEDKDWFYYYLTEFIKTRHDHIEKTGGNCVSLDICAVDPDHQRKGVGGKLVEWGTKKADSLGLEAVVESSIYGRGLYEKHGFVFQRQVTLPVSEKYPGREMNTFAWLTRPKSTSTST